MADITIMGFPFTIKYSTGAIIQLNSYQNSQTRTSGGGGRIYTSVWTGKVEGEIKPIQSHTYTNVTQEVHYRGSAGKEDYFRIVNRNIPFREGQEIELVSVESKDINRILFLGINNLKKKYRVLTNYNSIIDFIYSRKYGITYSLISFVVGMLLALPAFLKSKSFTGIFLVFAGFYLAKRVLSFVQKKLSKSRL